MAPFGIKPAHELLPDGGAEGVRTPDLLNAIQEILLTCIAVCKQMLFGGGRCQLVKSLNMTYLNRAAGQ